MTPTVHLRRARLLAPITAVALSAAFAGGAQAATPTTVFAGTTSADQYPLVLKVRASKIIGAATMFRASCSSGQHYSFGRSVTLTKPIAIRKGKFNGSFFVPETLGGGQTAVVTVFLKGTLKGTKLAGTVTGGAGVGSNPAGPDDTCVTSSLKFTITHRPGVIYGGATSQNLPVVIELARDRAHIQHLHVGWRASCTSGSGFQYADFLSGGAVTRGAFNGAFSADEDTSDGGSDHSEYAVSGKLTRTAGSGRIKVDLTSKDSAGTVVDTCSTGSVTFKVAS